MALFGGEVEPHRYLYHYTTRQVGLDSILATGTLRFGLFRDTNDPRESTNWMFSVRGAPRDAPDVNDLMFGTTDRIKSASKVLCLSRDDPIGVTTPPNEDFGRGYSHSRMWAQYAGGHTGVCLIFEREPLATAITTQLESKGELYAGDVDYADAAMDEMDAFQLDYNEIHRLGLDQYIAAHVRRHHRIFFFRKTNDWATEWEYRWVLRSSEPVPAFVSFNGAIRGVIAGASFPDSALDTLNYLVRSLGDIPAARCLWHNGRPITVPLSASVSLTSSRFGD